MDARTAGWIEQSVERTAATLFGGAAAYAVYGIGGTQLPRGVALGGGIVALLVSTILCRRLLARIETTEPQYELPAFDVQKVEPESIRGDPPANEPLATDGALELVDVLPEPAANSRVVRMFAPESMPAHTDRFPDGRPIPDAAKDLYDALAELRRSLR